ncbi:WhiB family transcriptional regulator [Rhodococcus opacus PD630]|uniref:WhiB family transcriptional regulator n=1 Tax=Rhodococcus opacus TaxID=37919 RepID=UPI00029CAFE3|nr:WhiB family transcriptional regulator [Rhodococcus opacus]EHI39224.1 WhiB family transcriptional regulator [Rhodococcus opacus PD630]UDG96989.1 WhiB family transcriptional regulator [Rhodococcus opacus PD630]
MSESILHNLAARRDDVTLDSGDWSARAACRDAELAVFFSPDDERGHARDRRETQARQICRPCPVLAQCRDHALVVGEPYGVWGGMTEGDRRKHNRRFRRGERRPLESLHARTVADVPRMRRSAPTPP